MISFLSVPSDRQYRLRNRNTNADRRVVNDVGIIIIDLLGVLVHVKLLKAFVQESPVGIPGRQDQLQMMPGPAAITKVARRAAIILILPFPCLIISSSDYFCCFLTFPAWSLECCAFLAVGSHSSLANR
jgi:hypothetical protein